MDLRCWDKTQKERKFQGIKGEAISSPFIGGTDMEEEGYSLASLLLKSHP